MPRKPNEELHSLVVSSSVPQPIISDFELYYRSVEQKLWSASYSSGSVQLDSDYLYPPSSGRETLSVGSSITQTARVQAPPNMENYCRFINLHLDGFLMNAMSSLDTLARLIITVCYSGHPRLNKIYITNIHPQLRVSHPNCMLTSQLLSELSQTWFRDFQAYRTCTTHESLIKYDVNLGFDQLHNTYRIPNLKLPDDPRAKPFTYRKRREVKTYCRTTNKRLQLMVFRLYESMLIDFRASGNIPIP